LERGRRIEEGPAPLLDAPFGEKEVKGGYGQEINVAVLKPS
jgi:hypothetical protein